MSSTTPSWVMTYNSLLEAVPQILERNDTATQNYIPQAITLAEFRIAQQLKTLGQQEVADVVLEANNPVLAKPARWRKTVSMTISSSGIKSPVLLRKLEYLNLYAKSVTAPGLPKYYADYDYDHWLLAPTPDQAYSVEVVVYTRLPPISASVQTNWLTQSAPNALLYGVLLEMVVFVKNDPRIPTWKSLYDEAMQALKAEDALRIADRSVITMDS